MFRFVLGLCVLLFVLPHGAASADELRFANGDRLQGKVVRLAEGTLRFHSDVLGRLDIPLAKIESVETEERAELHLSDGTVRTERIETTTRLVELSAINPEPVRWHGDLKAGLVLQRGNTDSQQGHGELALRRSGEAYRLKASASYEASRQRQSDDPSFQTTKRHLFGRAKYDRFLSERLFWFTSGDAERDGVADLDLRTILGTGLGYQLFTGRPLSLEFEIGSSWVHENYKDDTRDTDYAAAHVGWTLERWLSDPVRLFHEGRWTPSLREFNDNQLLRTETGLRVTLAGDWFGESKVRWTLNTEPSSGKERQDTAYLFSLGVGF